LPTRRDAALIVLRLMLARLFAAHCQHVVVVDSDLDVVEAGRNACVDANLIVILLDTHCSVAPLTEQAIDNRRNSSGRGGGGVGVAVVVQQGGDGSVSVRSRCDRLAFLVHTSTRAPAAGADGRLRTCKRALKQRAREERIRSCEAEATIEIIECARHLLLHLSLHALEATVPRLKHAREWHIED